MCVVFGAVISNYEFDVPRHFEGSFAIVKYFDAFEIFKLPTITLED
jgi:hypothetical protein